MEAPGEGGEGRSAAVAAIPAVLLATAVLLWILRIDLAFHPTPPAGGDMASHYPTFEFFRNELLPRGRLTGWSQGNLAGFPILEHYFPFPFLAMTLLSLLFSPEAAFKIGAILPAALLPASVAWSLRRMKIPAPVPAAGALLSLLFLLNERTEIWGGNLLSLLAGEIAYAYGLLFLPPFLAEIDRSVRDGRVRAGPIILEALLALSHGYAVLFGGLLSFFLLAGAHPARTLRILLATHLSAFLLLGGWLLPLLYYSPGTTPIGDIWVVESFREILPLVLLPAAVLAVIPLGAALRASLRREGVESSTLLFTGMVLLSLLLYRLAHLLHVVNIRFLPFGQLGLALLAALAFRGWGRIPKASFFVPLALASALGLFLPREVAKAPAWANWNFSGLPAREGWNELRGISERLKGGPDDPRVFYEHSPDHNRLGTSRVFESLPRMAGRNTMEGLYIEASASSPFIYYIQSELSDVASGVLRTYHYSHPEPETGLAHLDLFHARTLLIRSDGMKRRLDARADLARVADVGDYRIYERTDPGTAYAFPVRARPRVYAGDNPKAFAHRHFILHPRGEPVVVLPYGGEPPPAEWAPCVEGDLPLPAGAGYGESPPIVTTRMGNEEIRIHTTKPGWPILLAVSFHPRWRSDGARRYAATPSFMLLVPEGEEVVLRFARTWVEDLSLAATILGAGLLFFLPATSRPAASRLDAGVRFLFAAGVLLLAAAPSLPRPPTPQERIFRAEGMILREKNPSGAVREFDRLLGENPTPSERVRALHWRGVALEETHDDTAALSDHLSLAAEFPESEWAPEAAYRAARILEARGETVSAREIAARGERCDPEGRYSRACRAIRERL